MRKNALLASLLFDQYIEGPPLRTFAVLTAGITMPYSIKQTKEPAAVILHGGRFITWGGKGVPKVSSQLSNPLMPSSTQCNIMALAALKYHLTMQSHHAVMSSNAGLHMSLALLEKK